MENAASPRLCQFGPYRFDATARVLYRGGKPVRLTSKSLDLLAVLIENAGRVVSREEIVQAVWPHQFVSDSNLPQHISLLRKSLGLSDNDSEYIQTFPGKGYEFVYPVQWEPEHSASGAQAPVRRRSAWAYSTIVLLVILALGLILWTRIGRQAAPSPPSTLVRTPVVREAGPKIHPAISRDGSRIAFVWDRPNGLDRCVYAVEPQSEPVLVPGSCGNPSSPAWSPDGKRLAYLRHSSSSTALVVTESGRERLVAQMYPLLDLVAERMLDWSPDGRWIAACDKMEAEAPYSLYMFSPETGEKRLVSRWSEGPSVGDLDPRFSPKGDMLAFIRYENRLRKEVCVVSIQGGESRTLVGDLEKVGGVGWSRDGAYVLYSSNQESDHRLYRVALSAGGSDPQRTRTELYGSNPLQFSVSGGTDRLVYVESGDDLNIWRLDLRGGGDSSWAQVIASTGEDSAPQYSPDGQRIAFISDRSGSQQLWVSNADGSLPVQLTTGGLRPGHARWSPEGDLIVLNGHDGIVHTVPATGGDPKPLQGISCGMIGFAARPGWLLGSCRGNIAMVPATGGNPVTITSNGGLNARPSPVGDRVLYVRSRMSPEIWTVPVGGGPAVLVTNRLIPGCFGCWTPARTGVYYYRSEIAGGSPSIHFVSYDGTGDRFVANIPWRIPRLGTNHLSLTPDERYLLTVRRDTLSGDLYLVQPF